MKQKAQKYVVGASPTPFAPAIKQANGRVDKHGRSIFDSGNRHNSTNSRIPDSRIIGKFRFDGATLPLFCGPNEAPVVESRAFGVTVNNLRWLWSVLERGCRAGCHSPNTHRLMLIAKLSVLSCVSGTLEVSWRKRIERGWHFDANIANRHPCRGEQQEA